MRYIIAVAAPIGGGKTSFVTEIAKRLNDATTIHYDRYEKITEEPAHNLLQWLKNGANFNDFIIPNLSDDLEKLKRGEPIVDPLTNTEIPSKKYIIIEMPLGKEHENTAKYIDLLIWIEIPLDIALARKLKEFTGLFLAKHRQETYKDRIIWLDTYLDNYLQVIGKVLQMQKTKVSANADIIIDGQSDVETMLQHATQEILNKIDG